MPSLVEERPARRWAVVCLVLLGAVVGLVARAERRRVTECEISVSLIESKQRPDEVTALLGGARMDLSRVDARALQTVPGIGPALARRILAARDAGRLATWRDVESVRGVGPAKATQLRRYADVLPASAFNRPW